VCQISNGQKPVRLRVKEPSIAQAIC